MGFKKRRFHLLNTLWDFKLTFFIYHTFVLHILTMDFRFEYNYLTHYKIRQREIFLGYCLQLSAERSRCPHVLYRCASSSYLMRQGGSYGYSLYTKTSKHNCFCCNCRKIKYFILVSVFAFLGVRNVYILEAFRCFIYSPI